MIVYLDCHRHLEKSQFAAKIHFFFGCLFICCVLMMEVVASASRKTGIVNLSLARLAAILLARIRSSESTLSFWLPSGISMQFLSSSAKAPKPSIRKTMSKSSAPAPASIGGLMGDGGTYAAPTVCSAREIFRSPNFSNHKFTSCVTTGAPCSVAAESPTIMKRTRARSNAVSRRISFSANGSVAATDQTFLQSFQRRLFQQNQRVVDIVGIGLRIGRQH